MQHQKITIHKVKPTQTLDKHLDTLRKGGAVKATDFCAAMGIDTFVVK